MKWGIEHGNYTLGRGAMTTRTFVFKAMPGYNDYFSTAYRAHAFQGEDIMATDKESAKLTCPCCQAILVVDRETLRILYANENRVKAGGASFEQSLQDLREREKQKSGRFQQAMAEEKARKALLGKKFQELRKGAEETPTERPLRPFDLD